MAKFNDRRIVIQLINIENKIQVDDNMDDIAHNIHRHAVMADMMLPGWYDGWEAIYDAVAVQFAGINDNRHVMKEIYVATDGDMAFILMHIHLEQFYDGAPRIFAFRQFDTFQKIGERWLCRQAHCFHFLPSCAALLAQRTVCGRPDVAGSARRRCSDMTFGSPFTPKKPVRRGRGCVRQLR